METQTIRQQKERPPIIKLTEAAATRIDQLVSSRNANKVDGEPEMLGIRVGVSKRGCAGLEYLFEFAQEVLPGDNVIEAHGVKVFVNKRDELFLIGTILNYVEGDEYSGFNFENPNEKGRCGCGESFYA